MLLLDTYPIFSNLILWILSISFDPKWKGTRLLSPESECNSFLASSQTTEDLKKLVVFKQIFEMLVIDSE